MYKNGKTNLIKIGLLIYDIMMIAISFFLALWLRFDCKISLIPNEYIYAYFDFIPIYILICIVLLMRLHLYQSVWKFASYSELKKIILFTIVSFLIHVVGITFLFDRMPISYYVMGITFQFVSVLGIRFLYRFVLLMRKYNKYHHNIKSNVAQINVMLIGAGEAGRIIIKELLKDDRYNVACIIDDDPSKWNRYIKEIKVVGGRDEILASVKKYAIKQIIVAFPSADSENKREILNICNETECDVKVLPSIAELVDKKIDINTLKDVTVEDLLGRRVIQTDMQEVYDFISDKKILITGGGGSIGSTLARIIASHNPKELILFDIYENNVYDVQQELLRTYPELKLTVLIGSVRDSRRVDEIFRRYRPQVVYHAAAHKHVPLMEVSPNEAIKNNALGTYKVAYAAMMYDCERFVLISTDKAVNPTNIMGASKRMCEMIIQTFDQKVKQHKEMDMPRLMYHMDDQMQTKIEGKKTEFVAVRFGNVLGSNGSVIPLFKKQIKEGGPITVTHPDIIRYFMTIPEAASLVLLAGTYAKGGEIFVLDMGTPVKIDSLARNLIRLSGLRPDVDIKIEYTGLRPGEKLYEEKLMAEEGLKSTPNKLIHIGSPIPFDSDEFINKLINLMNEVYNNTSKVKELVMDIVPTYNPAGENGSELKGEVYERLLKERVSE